MRKLLKISKILMAFSLLFILVGCQATYKKTSASCKTWDQQSNSPQFASVKMLSVELEKVIGLSEFTPTLTNSGLQSIQTGMYNCSEIDVVLNVRTRFMGDRGQSEPPSAWKTVFLPPLGSAIYSESAISVASNRLLVDIYDANRGQYQIFFEADKSYVMPKTGSK